VGGMAAVSCLSFDFLRVKKVNKTKKARVGGKTESEDERPANASERTPFQFIFLVIFHYHRFIISLLSLQASSYFGGVSERNCWEWRFDGMSCRRFWYRKGSNMNSKGKKVAREF
jgi:hypothetical protein